MNGTIAQHIALTCHGNAFLNGHDVKSFLEDNSTCKFCKRITFRKDKALCLGMKENKIIAKTPVDWFHYLKSLGAHGIRLSNSPQNASGISDYMLTGSVDGGSNWFMEVILPQNKSEYWMSKWRGRNRDAPDMKIWYVNYYLVRREATPNLEAPDLKTVNNELVDILNEILLITEKYNFPETYNDIDFQQRFEEALDTIASKGKNFYGYCRDLAPEGTLSEQAITILNACQRAWVFRGGGIWNESVLHGDIKKCARAFNQLLIIVNKTLAAGANASFYK